MMVVLIKRYANRKLYNTESSRYITLKGISELLKEGREVKVVDNESGQDITPIVLSQILVDDQRQRSDSASGVPGSVLSELIARGGDAIYGVLRRSMDDVQDNLSDVRENVRRWINAPRELDSSEISRTVHQAVERVLRVVDLPTRADLEALNKNLERLSSALESFENRLADTDSES
jgi:polyhydroxyalkanoate synthesis repressor PhaR